jgi:pimeloyl-ACP methyl ester carboxylesterase
MIWEIMSPEWHFSDETYDQTAQAFDNPDHVEIVIHNYRWRQSLAPGEATYDEYERKLFELPPITVPAVTIGSDFDGAAADGSPYRAKSTGEYSHKVLKGVGHNAPQEAPVEFADAVKEIARF